jgi:hypothetical protein
MKRIYLYILKYMNNGVKFLKFEYCGNLHEKEKPLETWRA